MNCSNHSTSGPTMKLRLFALRDSYTLKIVPNMFSPASPKRNVPVTSSTPAPHATS